MEIKGRVLAVMPILTGVGKSGKSWVKQDFVIQETEGEYPKNIAFTGFGDKITPLVGSLILGEIITVHFNIESKEFNAKWFTNLNCWKIDKETVSTTPTPPVALQEDDLPF